MPIYLGRLGHGSISREPVFFTPKSKQPNCGNVTWHSFAFLSHIQAQNWHHTLESNQPWDALTVRCLTPCRPVWYCSWYTWWGSNPLYAFAIHLERVVTRQLVVRCIVLHKTWWNQRELNSSQERCKPPSPPWYMWPHNKINLAEAVRFELTDPFEPAVFKTAAISRTLPRFHKLVGMVGFEPTASCSQSRPSSQTDIHSVIFNALIWMRIIKHTNYSPKTSSTLRGT